MAKAPVAGGVKTRLARQIGVAHATRFVRHGTAALIARVAFDPRWQTTIRVAPDASLCGHHWPPGVARAPQGAGDLGRRMQRIFDQMPRGPVVIVGTDIPCITPAHIARAFALLGRHDAVFGPAADGGYWLVGARRRPRVPQPFCGVRWSSEHALADTLANLAGCSVGFVATLCDVDDAAALARHGSGAGRQQRLEQAAAPHPNPPHGKVGRGDCVQRAGIVSRETSIPADRRDGVRPLANRPRSHR